MENNIYRPSQSLKGEKIIDVGSGSGDLVVEIQKNSNAIIDIVDLNQEMLNEGKKRIKRVMLSFIYKMLRT